MFGLPQPVNLRIQPFFFFDLQLGLRLGELARLRRFNKARFNFDNPLQQTLLGRPRVFSF